MRLDIDSLRAFRAIVQTGSFTGAAQQLHLTQSAVSWKMKRLEERLGRTLLRRDGRSVEVTELGAELLEHAHRILDAHDEALDVLARSELTGTVHMGSNDEFQPGEIAALVRRYRSRHPGVRLHLRVGLSSVISTAMRAGELDLAVMQIFPEDQLPNDIVVNRSALQWTMTPDLEIPSSDPVPLITFGRNCFYRPIAEAALERAGIGYYVAFECESSHAVAEAISAGLGICLLDTHNVRDEHAAWTHPELDATSIELLQVIRTDRRVRSAAVRALVDELESALLAEAA